MFQFQTTNTPVLPLIDLNAAGPLPGPFPWYGIRTRSNCEKMAAELVDSKGYATFLPVYRLRRRWSDRVVETTPPLFPGYFFSRFDLSERVAILSTPGIVSIIGFANEPAPIPEVEIEAVQLLLKSGLTLEPCRLLQEGQRVRINHGALEGVEGLLLKKKSEWKFAVSIPLLQRSITVEIDPTSLTAA
jgi:transcription antitermination factor NusG